MRGLQKALMAAFAVLTLTALPLRAEVFQTLELMRQEALIREGVVSAVIDVADRSLKVTMADGSDMTVSPDNLDLVLNGIESEADRKAEVAHFMAQIDRAGGEKVQITPEVQALLRPVIAAEALFGGTDAAALPLWSVPVAPGLAQYMVIDAPGSVSYVTGDVIAESGVEAPVLQARAAENLRGQMAQMQMEEILAQPWIAGVVLDGFYECSLMTLPEVWVDLAAKHGRIGATCPSRGQLIVFDADAADAVAILRGFIGENAAAFPYPVSPALYAWTGDGWAVIDD